jgi:hypothetical protein
MFSGYQLKRQLRLRNFYLIGIELPYRYAAQTILTENGRGTPAGRGSAFGCPGCPKDEDG